MLLKFLVLTACVAYVSAQCAPNGALSVEVPPGEKAYIESPNYGNGDYPNNANCQQNVNSPSSAKMAIEINSVAFSLEGSSCVYDYVTIVQVNPNGAEVQLGNFCGEAGPQRLVANSTQFASDPVCDAASNLCSESDIVCIRPNQYCDGNADCPDGSDEGAICSGECGATAIPPKEDKSMLRFRSVVSDRARGKSDRIVGGVEATPHSLPWQVAMLGSSGSQICAGSIISPQWVMTAAHCCKGYGPIPSHYKVRAGVHVLGSTNEVYAKTYTLEKLIVHPNYQQPTSRSNDFCLLKINGMFEYGPHVGAICLADESDCRANTTALVSGWGIVRSGRSGVSSLENFDEYVKHIKDAEAGLLAKDDDPDYDTARVNNLMQAYVDVTTQEYCSSRYPGSITSDMICAARPGKDSCQGDSGGPLAQKNAEGKWKLCGVVSFRRGCAQANYPGVYGRVSYVTEWIWQTMLFN